MPRLALLLLSLCLAAAAAVTAPTATACPATPPGGPRCTKYDHMFEQMNQARFAPVYVRTRRGVLAPRVGGARVLRHLTASTWTARDPSAQVQTVRILDGANVPDSVDTTVHNAIVRGLAWSAGRHVVTFEGGTYAVTRCRDGASRMTTCLVRVIQRG